MTLTVAILGTAGYTGQEALDRVLNHPELEVVALGTDSQAGRPATALDLRLYRRVAAMDPAAPLPKLGPTPPDWSRAAAHASELGLGALAGRLEERMGKEG